MTERKRPWLWSHNRLLCETTFKRILCPKNIRKI